MTRKEIRTNRKAVLNCRTTQKNCLQKQDFTAILSDKTGLTEKRVKTNSINLSNL